MQPGIEEEKHIITYKVINEKNSLYPYISRLYNTSPPYIMFGKQRVSGANCTDSTSIDLFSTQIKALKA